MSTADFVYVQMSGLHHIRKVCQDFAGGKEVGEEVAY